MVLKISIRFFKIGYLRHFCMFGSYESTFYHWTAAFYGTKILRRVKKLLTFEVQSSDNFPIEIFLSETKILQFCKNGKFMTGWTLI